MNIELRRDPSRDGWTRGQLRIDGDVVCWTCEDVIRDGPRVAHETAIPPGRYAVVITRSRRFGRVLPELLRVDQFSGVRLHPGNTQHDTSGCVLLGLDADARGVWRSRAAVERVQARIAAALARGERVWMTVVNPGGSADGMVRLVPPETPATPATPEAATTPAAVPGAVVGVDP